MSHHQKLSDYQFDLPSDLIAQYPTYPRDHSRLLVYDRNEDRITDARFYELPQFLKPATSLVVNNSKVQKARIRFANVEIFELDRHDSSTMDALVRPGRKFKLGAQINLGMGITAIVKHIHENGVRTLSFNRTFDDPILESLRETPFPPYIKADESRAQDYQTVYAREEGSKAAPTAGLHFTPSLLQTLQAEHHELIQVTLHVGLGTFAPVKAEDIDDHVMHSEWYAIDQKAADQLNTARTTLAVGTTSVRVLESAKQKGGFTPGQANTNIFITPGYEFKAVDALITNFHLPGSTLIMLVSAFAGYEATRRLYTHAIKEKYRFYSFGDAMLIL